jgi:hypothetical protein
VVAKVRKRLAVSKETVKRMDMKRFNLTDLIEGKLSVSGYNKTSLQVWET